MITTINKQTSNTKKLSNFRISTYSAGITTPDKKTVEIIYNSYGVPNLSAVDLGLHGDRNVTLLKLNFKDLLWNTADITNYQISLFVDGSKVDNSFEMDNTNPIIIYPIDTTSLKVGTHEFVVSIMEKSKTSGSNIDMGQEVYLCRSFKGIINASDFFEPVNIFDFAGISNKGLRRHQIEVMLADDGQFALKQAITSEEQFSTDLGIQYDRFVSYICFNESTDITGKVTNLDKYIVFQNLTLNINYYVKLNTTSGHQHGTENTLTAWVPPQVTEAAGVWTIYFVGINEDKSIRFVSRSISLSVLPTTIPYDEVNPERGINIPVTFKLSFYYVSTSTKVAEAYAILRNASLNALKKITDTEQTIDLRQGEQYILELYPEGEWSYQGDKVIPESRITYTVPKNATADTFVGAYELTAEPPIRELMVTPTEEEQVFEEERVDGYKPVIVKSIQTETPTVNLSLASGNQTVNASSGKYIKSLTITKPSTLIASNIKSGVNIAGVNGSYEFKTQDKTFTPTQTGGSVSADSGYDGLGVVTVNPVPLGNKTDVPLNFYNQTAGTIADSQNIYSDENKFMTWASVSRPSTLIAENIKKDINVAGIIGTLESGGSSFPLFTGLFRFYTAPVISIENNTFSIATSVSNATSYEVYSDNVLLTTLTSSSETIDLSTLITDENTHTIYAIAKADSYADSSKSNEFSYTKVSTFYTVILPSSGWDSSYTPEYSLNNGITWHEFSASATIQTAQIKFRVTGYFTSSGPGGYWSQTNLSSTKLGMDITAGGSGYSDEVISDNYTLTQDIDDITCNNNVCCFVEGTQVLMADGTHKNIENIEVGEKVLTYNEENNSFEIDNVTRMVINPNTVDLATIVLSDNSRITFNAYHPFLTTEGFKSLTQHEGLPKLEIGDVLVSNKNNLTIIDIEREQLNTPIKTYNLTISRNHNFLVGEKDSFVVAHNIACPI